MPRQTSPAMEEKKRARRERLLRAATRAFGKHGYHATAVPRIVQLARSSVGSFYSYFRNKEDIFGAALDDAAAQLGAAMDAARPTTPGPRARVEALTESAVLWLSQNPAEARILIVESSGLSTKLEARRRAAFSTLTARYEAALADGAGSARDQAAGARAFLAAALDSARHWLETPEAEREAPRAVASRAGRVQTRGVA